MINTTYSFLYSTQLSQITRNGGSVTLTVFQNKLILNGLKRLSLNKMAQKEICFQNTQYVLNWEYSPQSKNLESVSLYKQKRRKYTFCGSNNQLCQLKYFLSGLIPFSDWEREFQFIKHIRKTKQCEIFVAKNYSNQEKALKNLNLGEPNQELEILKLLKSNPHPNVHGMESYFIDDFKCLVVMEYLNKGTLYEIQKSYKTNVPIEVIKEIMLQILEGLNHLHQLKIIHRDIKFDNIMIQEFKPIKVTLIDFGLSIIGKSTSSRAGTGGYIAPEVFTSCFIDEKSDIFSAGVVMHKLLTCKGIYENLEQNQAGHMHISTHIKDPNALDLLHQMLAKDPKLRYSASDCLGHPFFTEENDSLSSKMNLQNYLSPKGCKLQVNSPSTDFVSNQNIKLFKLN